MDIRKVAKDLPDRTSELRRFLEDAEKRLSGSVGAEFIQGARILTSALVFALNESNDQLHRGIARLDRELTAAQQAYEKGMSSLQAVAERLPGLKPELATYSLASLRSTQETVNASYKLAQMQDEIFRGFLLSYYERWFEAVYRAFGFFASERQREQLQTLLNVLVGMIPGVGTARDLIDLLRALRPVAVEPSNFRGVEQFERYSDCCYLLLMLFETLADIADGTAQIDDLRGISLDTRMERYRLSVWEKVDKRIQRIFDPVAKP